MQKVKRIKIDQSKIRTAIQAGIPLSITTYTLPMEMAVYIEDILKAFLKELNQEQMFEGLSYCVKELTNNAKKANDGTDVTDGQEPTSYAGKYKFVDLFLYENCTVHNIINLFLIDI